VDRDVPAAPEGERVIPGFPRIEALRFEGWLFADWEGTSLGGIPRKLFVSAMLLSCGEGPYQTAFPGPEDDWYIYSVPRKRPPAPREMRDLFVAPVATGGHL
jgi:hypothetical protein